LSGSHYQKTTKAWLANMDQYRQEIRELFIKVYGKKTGAHLVATLADSFMVCSELFVFICFFF